MAKDFNNLNVINAYDQHIRKLIPGYELIHLQVNALLKTYVAEDAEILVVGCGTGYELQYLAQQFPQWNFTAIDPALNMLNQAEQHLKSLNLDRHIKFIHGDTSVLKQLNLKFDAAVAILVSHFVPHDLKLGFFQDIAQSLSTDALCISYDLTQFQHASQKQGLKYLVESTGLAEAQANAMLDRLEHDFFLVDCEGLKYLYQGAGFAAVEQFTQVLSYVGLIGFKSKL